jgi:transcriptional regulator with XRE-family HTH domain
MHFDKILEIVKKRRDALNVTQEELSKLSGVGLRTIKQFERGKGNPTLYTLFKLVDVLGLEIELNVKQLDNHEAGENIL